MIVDKLENVALYAGISQRIAEAFNWLGTTDLGSLDEGTISISGDEILAIVQNYTTIAEKDGRFEAHRRFLDIQFVVSGVELILVAPTASLEADGPYNDVKDLEFLASSEDRSEVVLHGGMFALLFPDDAHMPKIEFGSPGKVKKIVVKVEL